MYDYLLYIIFNIFISFAYIFTHLSPSFSYILKFHWLPHFLYLVSKTALEKEMAIRSSILAWEIPWR